MKGRCFALIGILLLLLWFVNFIGGAQEASWEKEFRWVQSDVGHSLETELGLQVFGQGAAAFDGEIRSWIFHVESMGIPDREETVLRMLLKAREIAESCFEMHPEVKPYMHPDYLQSELFGITIRFRRSNGSLAADGEISGASISRGRVTIWRRASEGDQTTLIESYADFLARFPDTTLKATRDAQVGLEA